MNWQEMVVAAIGVAVAGVVVRWLWRVIRCGRSGCACCKSVDCPHRRESAEKKGDSCR